MNLYLLQKAALILASPCLPMRLLHNRSNKSFLLLIASDFERANWRSHIEGLRKNLSKQQLRSL